MDFRELFPDAHAARYDGEIAMYDGDTLDLDNLRFTTIIPTAPHPEAKAVWIDGGNAILASTPSRCIAIIKTCAVHTRGMERERLDVTTVIVSVTATDETTFTVRTKHIEGDAHVAASLPATIRRDELARTKEEGALITPSMIIGTLRALCEHTAAVRALNATDTDTNTHRTNKKQGDDTRGDTIVVKDGSLRTPDIYLRRHCTMDDHRLFALSKTSTLLTNGGRPLTTAIAARAPAATAWSAPLVKHETEQTTPLTAQSTTQSSTAMCIRLHPHSQHAFLLENANTKIDVKSDMQLTLKTLCAWSADAAFIGYPYPLVLADQLARVTDQEREMWRMMLAADAASAERLRTELRASDAHDVLEHILYGNKNF